MKVTISLSLSFCNKKLIRPVELLEAYIKEVFELKLEDLFSLFMHFSLFYFLYLMQTGGLHSNFFFEVPIYALHLLFAEILMKDLFFKLKVVGYFFNLRVLTI